jgi:hypothetical protein
VSSTLVWDAGHNCRTSIASRDLVPRIKQQSTFDFPSAAEWHCNSATNTGRIFDSKTRPLVTAGGVVQVAAVRQLVRFARRQLRVTRTKRQRAQATNQVKHRPGTSDPVLSTNNGATIYHFHRAAHDQFWRPWKFLADFGQSKAL